MLLQPSSPLLIVLTLQGRGLNHHTTVCFICCRAEGFFERDRQLKEEVDSLAKEVCTRGGGASWIGALPIGSSPTLLPLHNYSGWSHKSRSNVLGDRRPNKMMLVPPSTPPPLFTQDGLKSRGDELGDGSARHKDRKAMLGYWVPGGEGRNHKMPPAARGKMPANQLDVDKVLLTRTFNE